MTNDAFIQELITLLSQNAELAFQPTSHKALNDEPDSGTLTMRLTNIDYEQFQNIESGLKQLQKSGQATIIAAPDYSIYFQAVINSPTYKPQNPALALMQVAKAYNLDVSAFKKSFKENRHGL